MKSDGTDIKMCEVCGSRVADGIYVRTRGWCSRCEYFFQTGRLDKKLDDIAKKLLSGEYNPLLINLSDEK